MDTVTRRTSIYTVRLHGIDADELPGLLRAIADDLPPVQDRGSSSVSFRAADDGAARVAARNAVSGRTEFWSLTTGLGVHRRTVG